MFVNEEKKMQKIQFYPLVQISIPDVFVMQNKSGVVVGSGTDPKTVQESSYLLEKVVSATSHSKDNDDVDICLQREFNKDGLILSIGINTNFYDISQKELDLQKKEISKLIDISLSALEYLEKYSDGDDLVDIRFSEGKSIHFDNEGKVLFIPNSRAIEVVKSLAKLNHTLLKDKEINKINICISDKTYNLPGKIPKKISVLTCDNSVEVEAEGYIMQVDTYKHSFQIQPRGTHKCSERLICEYGNDIDSVSKTEQNIYSAAMRGEMVKVAGYPYVKKDVTGHHQQNKLKVLSMELNENI